MRKKVLRYGLEFLVVFSGILLSFVIDNRIKVNERIDNKDLLLNLGQYNNHGDVVAFPSIFAHFKKSPTLLTAQSAV